MERWSTDMKAAIPAAHVLCAYFDQEYGEWVLDMVFTGNIGKFPNEKWTHWRSLPLSPDEERKLDEVVSTEWTAIDPAVAAN